jgi:hypothetical protein
MKGLDPSHVSNLCQTLMSSFAIKLLFFPEQKQQRFMKKRKERIYSSLKHTHVDSIYMYIDIDAKMQVALLCILRVV